MSLCHFNFNFMEFIYSFIVYMSITYYSLEIKTLDEQYDILFSGAFVIDDATNKIIKFYSNTDVNTNILDADSNAIFDVNNKRFSENGTIIMTTMPSSSGITTTKIKIYTIKDVKNEYVNYIDYHDGNQWNTIPSDTFIVDTNDYLPKKFGFIINLITTTKIVMPKLRIDKYCELQRKLGLTRMKGSCFQALPLSKKYSNYNMHEGYQGYEGINLRPDCRNLRNKMKYAEYVRIHGTTQKSSSSIKQTCRFGATYRY